MIMLITLEQRTIAVESDNNASIEYAVGPLS
jgi:hypothetical protein